MNYQYFRALLPKRNILPDIKQYFMFQQDVVQAHQVLETDKLL